MPGVRPIFLIRPPGGFYRQHETEPHTWVRNASMSSPMSDETEEDHPAWLWLKELHAKGDHTTIENVVMFWRTMETLGRAGNLIRKAMVLLGKVLFWFAGILAAYLAATGDLLKLLGRSSGGS